jgi:hypothetical protein
VYCTESGFFDKIVDRFCNEYNERKKEGIFCDSELSYPSEYIKLGKKKSNNLHSKLVQTLSLAGVKEGLYSIPETRIFFEEPLIQRVCKNRTKKKVYTDVDNAFYVAPFLDRLELVGEVNTINDANVFLRTEEFARACDKGLVKPEDFPVMDSDVLIHLLNHSSPKPKFEILIVTLPKKARTVPWLSVMKKVGKEDEQMRKIAEILSNKNSRNFDEACRQGWIGLRERIKNETNTDCSLIVINEEGAARVDDSTP